MPTALSSLRILVLSISLFAPSWQTQPLPSAREDVAATIKEAVRLIDAREFKKVVLEFFPPEVVKKRSTSPEAIDQWATAFSTKALPFVLPKLRASMSVVPTFDETKTKAYFRFQNHEGGPSLFMMIKVGRYWYIDPNQ